MGMVIGSDCSICNVSMALCSYSIMPSAQHPIISHSCCTIYNLDILSDACLSSIHFDSRYYVARYSIIVIIPTIPAVKRMNYLLAIYITVK